MATWPNGSNTGVPSGVTLLPSGGITITQPGVTISGLKITGPVYIRASNVTLENCVISSSDFSVVNVSQGLTGVVIKNCELNGNNVAGNGILGTGTFLNNNIHNVENGITVNGNNTTIQGNYIHHFGGPATAHFDGVEIDGGNSNITVKGNTIILDKGQTSAVMIDNYFGPISNVTVEANLLAGGGFTIYVDDQFTSHPISNVRILNNHIGKGYYGDLYLQDTRPVYTGNVMDGWTLADNLASQIPLPDPVIPVPTPGATGATQGNDILVGDSGNNVIDGLGGNDTIYGRAGNDTLYGGLGNDTLYGEEGNDILIGGAGRDIMTGGPGNDTFAFKAVSDSQPYWRDIITDFTPGQDKIDISAIDANTLLAGHQSFIFLPANGAAFTGRAGELAWSTDARNGWTLVKADVNGDGVADFIVQLTGLVNLAARDFAGLSGTTSSPAPAPAPAPAPSPSQPAKTTINGTEGADVLVGDSGDNILNGFGGNDRLNGGAGNDILVGGLGTDILTGGPGNDVFLFRSAAEIGSTPQTRDIITDFTHGQDKIDLSAIDANINLAGDQAFIFLAANNASFTGRAGELAWRTEGDRTIIQGDINGDGWHDFELELSGRINLTQADFVL